MTFKIYALYDPRNPTEMRYIGQTSKTLEERLQGHLDEVSTKRTLKRAWIVSLKKVSVRPAIILVEDVLEATFRERERFWIAYYRQLGHRLTNLTEGGEGTLGWTPTDETRENMRRSHLGKKHTQETILKMRASNKRTCLGKRLSSETRCKMSLAGKGRKKTLEWRQNMLGNKRAFGKHPNMAARFKMRLANAKRNPLRTEEYKAFLRERIALCEQVGA
jgi:GIY-YIG catalytic domain/NUMOD3 motif